MKRVAVMLVLLYSTAFARAQDATAPANDLNVQAVLETNPTTPSELLRAITLLVELDRADAAKPLFAKLAAAPPDDATAAQLLGEFGMATFIKIALSCDEGKALSAQLRAAGERYVQDPQRIAELIQQLADPSAGKQALAIEQLRIVGPSVVNPLLATLANPAQSTAHRGAMAAIVHLGADAKAPLVGALEALRPEIVAEAASALARLDASDAIDRLLPLAHGEEGAARDAARAALETMVHRVPSAAESADFLEDLARRYLSGRKDIPPGSLDDQGAPAVTLWHWNVEEEQTQPRQYTAAAARAELAALAARSADRLTPADSPRHNARQQLALVTYFDTLPPQTDPRQTLALLSDGMAKQLGADGGRLLAETLDQALVANLPRAATVAAQLLGQLGDRSLLAASGPPSALVRGLAAADRETRFASLAAVAALQPSFAFSGSSQVATTLAWFISTVGQPRAVAAANSQQEAGRLAGLLAGMGYDVATATDGTALVQQAAESSDTQVIVIDAGILRPEILDCVVLLKNDPRTAAIPLAIATPSDEERFRNLEKRYPVTRAIIRPHNSAALKQQLDRLTADAGYAPPNRQRRAEQAKAAMAWASEMARRGGLFDLRALDAPLISALYDPDLTVAAGQALAQVGSAEAQTALVEFASQVVEPLALREAAAKSFGESVARYGILLTTAQMQQQYARYNASETLDAGTQAVLSSILDSMEAGRQPAAAGAPAHQE
ncbi:MAG: hypothetical protein K1X71_10375 [Pirellulales bacterium]|nr:hypothetical protein [Pirellulales bacterium]